MKCKYCFYLDEVKNRIDQPCGIMKAETLERIVAEAFLLEKTQITFAFQGGEPTLAGLDFFELFIRLTEKYNKNGVKVEKTVQTNGYMLDEKWAEFFAKNGFLVGLSIDGEKCVHDSLRVDQKGCGTFDIIEKTLDLFDGYGVEYNVLCVATKQLCKKGKESIEYLINRGVTYIQTIPFIKEVQSGETGGMENAKDGIKTDKRKNAESEKYAPTEKEYGDFLCDIFDVYFDRFLHNKPISIRIFDNYMYMLAGKRAESCEMSGRCAGYYVFESDGSAYPCDFYCMDGYRLGNINDGLSAIMRSPKRYSFATDGKVESDCFKCKYYGLCNGGCKRYKENGKYVYCESVKAFLDKNLEKLQYMAKVIFGGKNG